MEIWGKNVLINLCSCNLYKIRDRDNILSWGDHLVKKIEMIPYGEPFLERFSLHNIKAAGYTYFQAIETSNITAHFSENNNGVFINIFSCKDFKHNDVVSVCNDFFNFNMFHSKIFNVLEDGRMIETCLT